MIHSARLESTKEALNILHSLRQKRTPEHSSSLYSIIKQTYTLLLHRGDQSTQQYCPDRQPGHFSQPSQSQLYLQANSRERMEDMLIYIKGQVELLCSPQQKKQLPTARSASSSREDGDVKALRQENRRLQDKVRECEQQILDMKANLKQSNQKSKVLQLKLLGNVKKLNAQLQQKCCQIEALNQLIQSKDEEINDLHQVHEKRYKKIRQLEEELFELETELQSKQDELETERECSVILENKISRLYRDSSFKANNPEQSKQAASPVERDVNQISVQTEERDDDLDSSFMNESKESKYLESIERLSAELGDAYTRINDLMHVDEVKPQKKPKTSSAYFGRFFK